MVPVSARLLLLAFLLAGGASVPAYAKEIVTELGRGAPEHLAKDVVFEPVYPNDKLIISPPQRRVKHSTRRDVRRNDIIGEIKLDAVTGSPRDIKPLTPQQKVQALGYPFTAEGFLNAARAGDVKALEAFLVAGMLINSTNIFGSTALMAGVQANQLTAVQFLVEKKANTTLTDKQGDTPLHLAARGNFGGMVSYLVNAGTNVQAVNLEGWTPLFMAALNNNTTMVNLFVQMGADVNAMDKFGMTPLMLAVRGNGLAMVKHLLGLGAHVSTRDLGGNTPLLHAVSTNNYAMVKLLLDNGANANDRTKAGTAAMDVALEKKYLGIANLLLGYGAERPNVLGQ
ncbi:MAG: ankyrin repeat domain-containing protein [Alphaproteobacteria bacterium]